MSTKVTIKHLWDDESQAGYHLFTDALDSFLADENGHEPVYLELNGVEFTASSPGNVQVKIPRAWAVKLGLVSTENQ